MPIRRGHRLLVVDWDSFFPEPNPSDYERFMLYDWAHKEAPFFTDGVWPHRAADFIRMGRDLPDLDGREQDFWKRFNFGKNAQMWYADSNASAVNPLITGKRVAFDEVWLYDAHHDSGYLPAEDVDTGLKRHKIIQDWVRGGLWGCDYWTVLYGYMGALVYVRYPQWKPWAMVDEPKPIFDIDRRIDDGSTPDVEFSRVFVCRSSAWVPPWHNMDERFEQFIDRAPIRGPKVDLTPGGLKRREFDLEEVRRSAEQTDALIKMALTLKE